MPLGKKRDNVLYGILRKRKGAEYFTVMRWAIGIVFTLAIAALPLLDVMRFDFWSGRHVVMGREVGIVEAARAFVFPFLAVNILIIVVSRFYGRYLCGFVCPVGSLARIAEWARYKDRKGRVKLLGPLVVLLVCALLAVVTFSFWVDWRVFREGSPLAVTLSVTFLGGTLLGLFVITQIMGLRFCHDWCPSGVYFALLGHETANGISFAHPENCTECKACEKVCPMDLNPTHMSEEPYRPGSGLYGDGMSNHSLCIRCGDCVVACEGTTRHGRDTLPLRLGPLVKKEEQPA